MGYVNRLQVHVEKENNVVYPMAERELPADVKEKIDAAVRDLETEDSASFTAQSLALLDKLEAKYHLV